MYLGREREACMCVVRRVVEWWSDDGERKQQWMKGSGD
jgi:hypothetical protein